MPRPLTTGALAHLRVIDLSRVRAGPTCVRQLADFGADVIKVEPPPGSGRDDLMIGPRDGADMQNLHRNKRTLTLDLKSEAGNRVLRRLVQDADVVVENFRPDVKQRLGLDYDTLAGINPRIILASISGFGQDGPYRERPGFDQVAQGMSRADVGDRAARRPAHARRRSGGGRRGRTVRRARRAHGAGRARTQRPRAVGAVLAAARGHRAHGFPGRALPGRRRSAGASRQRPPDQHADLGLPYRRRPHQRRGRRPPDVAHALPYHRPRGSARTQRVRRRGRPAPSTAQHSMQSFPPRCARAPARNGSRRSTRPAFRAGPSTA